MVGLWSGYELAKRYILHSTKTGLLMKLLIYALLFYIAYTLFIAFKRSLSAPRQQRPPEKSSAGETMERDPNCGTYLPRRDAISQSIKGTTYYFCSDKCRDSYSPKK
jgi:YHS domain-containing protein